MSKIILEFSHEEIDQVIIDLQKLATVMTMDQVRAQVGKEYADRIHTMSEQIEALNNPPASKGLCSRCNQRLNYSGVTIIPRDVKSDGVDSRPASQKG